MHRNRQRAFTLLELILVLALMGMLAAIVWPDFTRVGKAQELDESATRFKALVAMCRAQAMNEARRYRVTFRTDGTVKLARQLDAVYAPHVFFPLREQWARTKVLSPSVFVESLVSLPDGPPPIIIEDDHINFTDEDGQDFLDDPIPVQELDNEVEVFFEPDGTSDSLRWTLRAESGRGRELTLDGRLGRVTIELVASLDPDQVERPEPIPDDEADEFDGVSETELREQYTERDR